MAVRLLPNQLVKLHGGEDFNTRNKRLMLDYRTYCQMVREEQTTMFQVQVTPDSEDLIVNGDFQNDISDWVHTLGVDWVDGRARLDYISFTPILWQEVAVTEGTAYQLRFSVEFTEVTNQLLVIISNQQTVYAASELGVGTHTLVLTWVADSTEAHIEFQLTQELRDVTFLDEVSFHSFTEPVVTLETCSGDTVKTIPVFDRSDDFLTYSLDWFGLPEGCYNICISGIDDTEHNYLDLALALGTEGGAPIELEEGGYLKWF